MDKKIFPLLLFFSAIGLCTGCFFEVFMTGEGKTWLSTSLMDFFSGESLSGPLLTFWQNIWPGALFLLICFFSPAVMIFFPLGGFFLFLKGLSIGFSASMLIEAMGLRGLIYILLTLVPTSLIQVLLMAFLLALSFGEALPGISKPLLPFSGKGFRSLKKRNALQLFTGQYLHCYLIGLIGLILTCLLKVFLLRLAI